MTHLLFQEDAPVGVLVRTEPFVDQVVRHTQHGQPAAKQGRQRPCFASLVKHRQQQVCTLI